MRELENETWIVAPEEADERLDLGLSKHFESYSRTYFQRLIEEGLVVVNGKVERKRYKIAAGDEIEVEFPLEASSHLIPEKIDLDILYEDEHLLVIHKPASMVVHPGAGNFQGTLANALAYRGMSDPLNPHRPGIVHRLDKDTSGVIVTAKNSGVHALLVEAFASRRVEKTYLTIACKHAPAKEVNAPIGRDPHHRQKMAVVQGARAAITRFEIIATSQGDWPLYGLKVALLTGRTHQIRVHLRHSGCPILGDNLYGWPMWNERYEAKRQLLHAWQLAFDHPITGAKLRFEAPLPEDMAQVWQRAFGDFNAMPKALT